MSTTKRSTKAKTQQAVDTFVPEALNPPTPSIQDRMDISIVDPTSFSFSSVNTPATVTEQKDPLTTRRAGSSQAWHTHKKNVVQQNPGLSAVEQLVLAKKTYEPAGRQRSLQSIHKEIFLLRHPNHGLGERELASAVRSDFINRL